MALKPSLPQKIVRAGPWNRVHPTSPIWGREGQHKAAAGFGGRGHPRRPGSSCPWLPSQGSWAALPSAPLSLCSPCSPFLQLPEDLLKMLITPPVQNPGIRPASPFPADLPDLISYYFCPRTFVLAAPTAWILSPTYLHGYFFHFIQVSAQMPPP